jgi:acyl carrier protein
VSAQHTEENIYARIHAYLDEHLTERPAAPIVPGSRIIEDLGLDSLQSFEMVAEIEDHYGITIPMERFQSVVTLEDVVTMVRSVLEADERQGAA